MITELDLDINKDHKTVVDEIKKRFHKKIKKILLINPPQFQTNYWLKCTNDMTILSYLSLGI